MGDWPHDQMPPLTHSAGSLSAWAGLGVGSGLGGGVSAVVNERLRKRVNACRRQQAWAGWVGH